jgi:hypothetical protein
MKSITVEYENLVREAAEKAVHETRDIKSIEIGKAVRQGDIYIHRVEATHARGKQTQNRQLAMGNTQGSRHIAETPSLVFEGTTRPTWCTNAFLGPVVESPTAFKISHPEHSDVQLPAGTYQITHQMDARTLQRVKD